MIGSKRWVIVTWRHIDELDGQFGRVLDSIYGTYEEAVNEALEYVPDFSPISVLGVIE